MQLSQSVQQISDLIAGLHTASGSGDVSAEQLSLLESRLGGKFEDFLRINAQKSQEMQALLESTVAQLQRSHGDLRAELVDKLAVQAKQVQGLMIFQM